MHYARTLQRPCMTRELRAYSLFCALALSKVARRLMQHMQRPARSELCAVGACSCRDLAEILQDFATRDQKRGQNCSARTVMIVCVLRRGLRTLHNTLNAKYCPPYGPLREPYGALTTRVPNVPTTFSFRFSARIRSNIHNSADSNLVL